MARRRSSSKRSSPRAALIRSLRRSAELSMEFSDERDNLDELSLKQLRSLSKKMRNPRRAKRNCGRNPHHRGDSGAFTKEERELIYQWVPEYNNHFMIHREHNTPGVDALERKLQKLKKRDAVAWGSIEKRRYAAIKRQQRSNPYREDTFYADREIRKVKKAKRSKHRRHASKTGMKAVLGRMNPRGKGRLRTTGTAGGKYTRYLERTAHKPKARKGRPSFKGGKRGEFRASRAQHRRADLVWAGRHESIRKRSHRSKNPRSARPGENDIPTVVVVRKGKGRRNPPITPAQARTIKQVLRIHGY